MDYLASTQCAITCAFQPVVGRRQPIVRRLGWLFVLLLGGCFSQRVQAQYIRVNDTLRTGTTLMRVKGLQGFGPALNKQKLRFGLYQTLDFKRNSTKRTYHYSRGLSQYWGSTNVLSSENFSFRFLEESSPYMAEALCTNQSDSFPDNWLFQTDLVQGTKDLFSGSFSIRPKDASRGIASDPDSLAKPNWNFVIRNVNIPLNVIKDVPAQTSSLFSGMKATNQALRHEEYRTNQAAEVYGILARTDDDTEQIQINAVSGFNRKILIPDLIFGHVPGYEFRYKGQVVGAVEVINFGHVWLKEKLDPELKFVVATMAIALLGQSFQKQ